MAVRFKHAMPVALVFGIAAIVMLAAVAAKPAGKQSPADPKERYLSPIEMTLSTDGRLLYVVCEGSDEVRILETGSGRLVGRIPVGRVPRGIASSPNGKFLYVTNAWSDDVSVIDALAGKVIQTLSAGFEPTGVLTDASGTSLYVANRLSGDVSVIDLNSGQETKRLLAGRGA
ncbi:MAG TPA: YncE family protein, partial [Candidatus Acidoferrum sp.]|nr:YncE family protein [Candidatus Acidoferrum sp.]